jgi:hypothetical protein
MVARLGEEIRQREPEGPEDILRVTPPRAAGDEDLSVALSDHQEGRRSG